MSAPSTIPTPASPDVCTYSVLVDGTELPSEFHVRAITVTRELNRIPSASLHIIDGEASQATFRASNADLFVPGAAIEIKLGYQSQNETVFSGIVVSQTVRVRKSGGLLVVECRDAAVRMTTVRRHRTFTDSTDGDILEDIVSTYGLRAQIEDTAADVAGIVQYDCTDWDFLLCRAEANGKVVLVRDGEVIIAAPDVTATPALSVQYGATVLELDAELDARLQPDGMVARGWSMADQEMADADAREPATTGNGNLSPDALADGLSTPARELRHGGALGLPELQAWADGRLMRERLAKVRGRVRCQGFAGILPGQTIEVQGIGERFQGTLYATGVRHALANGNWETDVQFGTSPEPFVEAVNLRPLPAAGLLPAVSGLQIGLVTALEGDPDGEERIQIRIPRISETEEGIWARIATLDAGAERGTVFRPEIGDEVVLGFLDDDPRHPVVLGMCHSSAKTAPEPASDANHRKGYVSRERLTLGFDDEKKSVTVSTPAGNMLTLSEDDASIRIADQHGNTITLNADGITIESISALTLKAGSDIRVEGVGIEISAQSSLTAKGTGSAELSSTSTTVKGSATTVIQGGVVQIN